jgi:magnesium-transporting ATPase (P-type)
MYAGLLHAHSSLRYIILIVLIVAVVNAVMKWQSNKPITAFDNKLSLYALIFSHIQLVIGFVLYFISPIVESALSQMPETMGETQLRYWAVEHITAMIIGVALVTVGRVRSKKQATDLGKHKQIAIWMGLGLLVILASIPWPFRGFGNAWF